MEENSKKEATQVSSCKTCKKGLNNSQWFMFSIGVYILGTSAYGTVELIKLISKLF